MLMKSTFSKRTFLLFFLIVIPLFLNLNFSGGVRFDASPFNFLGLPSLPLMLIFFSVLALLNILNYRFKMSELVLVFLVLITLFLSFIMSQNFRIVLLAFGMVLPIFFVQLFITLLKVLRVDFEKVDFVAHFFAAISIMILIKFLTDLAFFGTVYSEFFIFSDVVIYNSFDYFPVVYILAIVLSVNNMYEGSFKKLSLLVIGISLLCATMSYSRLFAVFSVIAVPIYVLFRSLQLRSRQVTFITSLFCIVITIGVAVLALKTSDQSLITRFSHWYLFFSSFGVLDIIFPFWNSYRIEMNWGTFHNELLEIYSYYGFVFFLYLYVLNNIFTSPGVYRYTLTTLLFLFLIGGLIQLNLTNPYVVLIISGLCASIKCNEIGR